MAQVDFPCRRASSSVGARRAQAPLRHAKHTCPYTRRLTTIPVNLDYDGTSGLRLAASDFLQKARGHKKVKTAAWAVATPARPAAREMKRARINSDRCRCDMQSREGLRVKIAPPMTIVAADVAYIFLLNCPGFVGIKLTTRPDEVMEPM